MKYPIKKDPNITFDMDMITVYCNNGEKINLIKMFREVSGLGLKDSKDTIEKYENKSYSGTVSRYTYNIKGLIAEFKKYLIVEPDPYTKEEFLHLIENAIDNMNIFAYTDMIEATITLLKNVKINGGLEKLAAERDEFLNGI